MENMRTAAERMESHKRMAEKFQRTHERTGSAFSAKKAEQHETWAEAYRLIIAHTKQETWALQRPWAEVQEAYAQVEDELMRGKNLL